MIEDLRKKILDANIEEHKKEAQYYDIIHTEIFNTCEQNRILNSLKKITDNRDKNANILDIGCGTGNITKKLINFGFKNITCLDISKEMLDELKKAVQFDSKCFINSDIDSFLENNKEKFDIITISSVVHHLPDYEATINNILELLNANGILYITHEPYKQDKSQKKCPEIIIKLLRKIDFILFAFRYLFLILVGKLIYFKRDCRYSDYHTGERCIDVENLKKIFSKYEYEITTYSIAKSSLFAWIFSKIDVNGMEIIVHKK